MFEGSLLADLILEHRALMSSKLAVGAGDARDVDDVDDDELDCNDGVDDSFDGVVVADEGDDGVRMYLEAK